MGKDQPRSAERYFANFRYKAEMLIQHPRLLNLNGNVMKAIHRYRTGIR
ncbi:hypothetical protein NOJ17_08505 [Neorhizobium galegae]|nr:hypothetical protein [Neorhizobium galegae]UIY32665.1 hypothetical protein LZK73_30180 [Neorhizobium galegae]